jgi:hypothetical protein
MIAVDEFMELPIDDIMDYAYSIDMNPMRYEHDLTDRVLILPATQDEIKHRPQVMSCACRQCRIKNKSSYKVKHNNDRLTVDYTPIVDTIKKRPQRSSAEIYQQQVELNESLDLTKKYKLIDDIIWILYDMEMGIRPTKTRLQYKMQNYLKLKKGQNYLNNKKIVF